MFCSNCGCENDNSGIFCIKCGSRLNGQTEKTPDFEEVFTPTVNVIGEKSMSLIKSPAFLTLCILISCSVFFSIIGKGFPLFEILATIFLWIIYSKGRKNIVDIKNLRHLSGTAYAMRVVTWIIFGFVAFLTAIFAVVGIFFGSTGYGTAFLNRFLSEFNSSVPFSFGNGFNNFGALFSSFTILVVCVLLLIVTVIIFLLAVFCYGSIHKFAKSLYRSIENSGTRILCAYSARSWLMVLGIFEAISALSSFSSNTYLFISYGTQAAALIVASTLISKYFCSHED